MYDYLGVYQMIENRGKKSRYLGGKHESQRDVILRIIKTQGTASHRDIQDIMKIKSYVIRGRCSELKTSGHIFKNYYGDWQLSQA